MPKPNRALHGTPQGTVGHERLVGNGNQQLPLGGRVFIDESEAAILDRDLVIG